MKSTKVIKLLLKIPERDKRKFRKFIESPYFNETQSIVKLYSFIESFKKENYDDPELNYESLSEELFPADKFQKDAITKLLSKLYQLLQSFLLHQQVDIHSLNGKLQLLSKYLDLNEMELFESLQKDIDRHIKAEKNLDSDFYYDLFQYQGHIASYLSMKGIRKGDINLQELNLALDKYFIVSKLYHLCLMKNRERIIQFEYNYTLREEIIEYVDSVAELSSDPIITTWKSALQLLENPLSEDIYMELKEKKGRYKLFSQVDARSIFTFLENATRELFGDGDRRFKELMDLYKMQLDSGVMYFNDYLHKNILKNIITVAIHTNQLDWARDLLQSLKKKNKIMIFPEEQSQMVYNFNMASVLFHKREFENARQLLYVDEFNDIFYKLDSYVLLLEIRYETADFHEIESFINKFRVFLHRSKELKDKRKDIYRSFLNIYELLYKTRREATEKKRSSLISKMKKKLETEDYLYERDWFNRKIKQIETI
ncbi:MAG: hypothetical protein HKN92_01205 [Chitinophagales bacterium]|nr:hypothetical protein [Chitinophagales bacterium]